MLANNMLPTLLLTLFAFSSSTTALPTASSSRQGAAVFEPLYFQAAPAVGPSRSIERLRLRRAAVVAATVKNPKRSLVVAPITSNPKLSKRSIVTPVNLVVQNPKTKRSSVVNPKTKRDSVVVVERSILFNPKQGVYERDLISALGGTILTVDGTMLSGALGRVEIIPNPKSPTFGHPVTVSVVSGPSPTSTVVPLSTSVVVLSTMTVMHTTTTVMPTTTMVIATPSATTATSTAVIRVPSPTATTATWPKGGSMIAAAYFPDWTADILPPDAVDFNLFDLIDFAFAIPTANFDVRFTQDNSGTLLHQLVALAHANNTKVLISVGGWTGSNLFSAAVASPSSRATFVANIVKMVNTYGVDGIDIDWEYPGTSGNPGNGQSPNDTANFLIFLNLLRQSLAPDARISACVTQGAFIGADGSPLADVSAFAAVLDNILVMNYDVWGASSTPGPNAPLSNACPDSNQPNANQASGIAAWTAAGMPADKILMGIPSYGYISSSTATTLVHKRSIGGTSNRERAALARAENAKSHGRRSFEAGQVRLNRKRSLERAEKRAERKRNGDVLKKRGTIIVCPNNHSGLPCAGITGQAVDKINWNPLANFSRITNSTIGGNNNSTNGTGGIFVPNGGTGIGKLGTGDLSTISGNQIEFYQMLSHGVIAKQGDNYVGVNGYVRVWDTCSSTPFLYNTARKVVITYDDPISMALKGALAQQKGIAGLNMWDMSGDSVDWALTRAFRGSMGLSTAL